MAVRHAGVGHARPGRGGNLTLTLNPAGLAPGVYTASLRVRSNDMANAEDTVPVTLTVGGVALGDGAGWRMLAPPASGMTVDHLAAQNLVQGVPGYYPTAGANLFTSYNGTSWIASTGTGQARARARADLVLLRPEPHPRRGEQQRRPPGEPPGPGERHGADGERRRPAPHDGQQVQRRGNPFLASLDVSAMNTWATGGVLQSATGQVYDPAIGSYLLTTNMGGRIASWQGMMIENSTATGLTIPLSARTTGGVFEGLTTAQRMVAFTLDATDATTGLPTSDQALALYFHPDGTEAADLWDASKLTPLASAYALLAFEGSRDGAPVLRAQESRPLEPTAAFDVPMALEAVGTAPSLTLRWPTMSALPETWTITLEDLATGTTTDLRVADHYTFTAAALAPRAVEANSPPDPAAHAATTTRFVLHVNPGVTTGSGPGALPTAFDLGAPAPNPTTGAAALRYDVPAASDVAVEVFDLLGRRVATLVEGPVAAGRHEARLDAGSLSAGVYVVRMRAGDFVAARRLTIVR